MSLSKDEIQIIFKRAKKTLDDLAGWDSETECTKERRISASHALLLIDHIDTLKK